MASAEYKEGSKILSVGNYAPDFTLDRDGGESITLSELKGENIVVYFYPKDDTPGCTQEANDFTELAESFELNDTIIIGISKDNVEKHDKFKEKYNLSVILAADTECSVCEAYDCWVEKSMYGKKYMGIQRDTFLIDKKGIINKIWRKVKVNGHVEEVLEAAKELS